MSFDTRDQKAVADLAAAQKRGDVIGLGAVSGGVLPRRDIDDYLFNDENGFNLFLLALQALQDPSQQSATVGYYQIAGIHGMPRIPWNNVTVAQKSSSSGGFAGYCAHAVDIFPTWHRPYLALIEQTIYSKIIEIVQVWLPESERPNQLKAARNFRLPYWDYWKPRGGLVSFPGVRDGRSTSFDYDFRIPDIFVAKKVMVRKPKGTKLEPIDNPLVSFNFPKRESDAAWGDYWEPSTNRYPGVDRPVTAMNYQLNMGREGANTQYINMVRDPAYKYYADFGTNAIRTFAGGSADSSSDPKGSLENIHNNYHGRIGGGGQMSDPSVAAFDPVFWIHHCVMAHWYHHHFENKVQFMMTAEHSVLIDDNNEMNSQIDRLLAIWQATHPNSWFDGDGTSDANIGLVPFTSTNSAGKKDWWTSNTAKKPDTLGYTYSDIDRNQTPDSIRDKYIGKYNWATQNRLGHPPKGMEPLPIFEQAQVYRYDGPTKALLVAESAKTGALDAALKKVPVKQLTQISTSQSAVKLQALLSRSIGSKAPIVKDRVLLPLPPSELVISDPKEVKEANVERTWFVDNVVERLALNGTFTIFFFIGAPNDNEAAKYFVQPTLAGITHNFAAPIEYCDNCGHQEEQGHLVSGTVVITPILKDYIALNELADLTPESVKPFLVKHLRWRIVTVGGQSVDPRTIPGLKLGVSSKVAGPEPRQVRYQEYNDIVTEILQNAS